MSVIERESKVGLILSPHLGAGDDDDELFLRNGWPTKGDKHYFQPGPLLEFFTIANLQHAANRIWTGAEP